MERQTFKPGDKVTRVGRPEWGVGTVEADQGQYGFKVQFLDAGFADQLGYAWADVYELEAAPFTTTPSKIAQEHAEQVRDLTAEGISAVTRPMQDAKAQQIGWGRALLMERDDQDIADHDHAIAQHATDLYFLAHHVANGEPSQTEASQLQAKIAERFEIIVQARTKPDAQEAAAIAAFEASQVAP